MNVLAVALAAVGAVVAGVFAAQLAREYLAKRRHHALAWALSLSCYAVGMVALVVGFASGWSPASYGVYWLTGALLNVPLLAVGQLHLLDPGRAALWWTFALLFAVWTAGAMLTSPFDPQALAAADASGAIPEGRRVLGAGSLAYAVLRPFTIFGTIVVLGGCLWSGLRNKRYGILLIALGVLVSATSSSFLRAGLHAFVAVALTAGVSIMYAGFLAAGKPSRRRQDPMTAAARPPPPRL
ncbi:hypothetical protein BH20ACT8_BH20ACT8_18090 [soil metagenome]